MSYTKKTWENLPSTNTPVNATGMDDLETRIKALDTSIIDMIGLGTTTTKSIPNSLRIDALDFNEVEGTGLFIAYGPCTNAPANSGQVASHWYLIQIQHSANYRFQLAHNFGSNPDYLYRRVKSGGTWSEWKQV